MKKSNFILSMLIIFGVSIGSFAFASLADTIPPTAPTSVSATNGGSGQIVVNWGASTDDTSVVGYYVYRNGAQIANVDTTTYTDSGLTVAVYAYTVAAYDAAGNLSRQSDAALATAKIDTTAPAVPAGLSATYSYHPPQIVLSWSGSTDDIGVVGYYITRNGIKIKTDTAITGTTYTDVGEFPAYTNITAGNTYTYTVQAYDLVGNISARSAPLNVTITIDESAPSIPVGVSAMATSGTSIAISWSPSYDNVGIAGYYVYRAGEQVGDTGSSSTTTYVDSGLTPDTYAYTVAAYDAAGNISGMSQLVNAKIIFDNSAPSAPTILSATALYATQATIRWNASTDDVGVTGYDVYRDGYQITSVNKNFYTDMGLAASTTYMYTVTAYDLSGNMSTSSPPLTVTTPDASVVSPPPSSVGSVIGSSVVVTPAPPGAPSASPFVFTLSLYRGVRNNDVAMLQNVLIQNGYLAASSATGYFGTLTEQAVKKFQCDHAVVCTGSPGTTGWGVIGGRTRAVLNSLFGGANTGGTTTNGATTNSSTAQLTAQLQSLQALLLSLQLQAQALHK